MIARMPAPDGPDQLAQAIETTYERIEPYAERSEELDPPSTLRVLHDRATTLSERDRVATDRLIGELRRSDEPQETLERGSAGGSAPT